MRVQRGMALLDEREPGWEHQIDLAELDMNHGCKCILGQIGMKLHHLPMIGSAWRTPYLRMIDTLGLLDPEFFREDKRPSVTHGFFAPYTETFEQLEEEWITQIKRRFDTGVFSDAK